MRFSPSALLIIALLPLAACKPVVNYNPQIDPANFSATVDHPLFKLAPGSVWNFEGVNEDGDTETGRVEVLAKEKIILGIPMAVIRDQVWINGELHEDTEDWYAQDEDGNVWYFGEAVDNYEDGAIADHDQPEPPRAGRQGQRFQEHLRPHPAGIPAGDGENRPKRPHHPASGCGARTSMYARSSSPASQRLNASWNLR